MPRPRIITDSSRKRTPYKSETLLKRRELTKSKHDYPKQQKEALQHSPKKTGTTALPKRTEMQQPSPTTFDNNRRPCQTSKHRSWNATKGNNKNFKEKLEIRRASLKTHSDEIANSVPKMITCIKTRRSYNNKQLQQWSVVVKSTTTISINPYSTPQPSSISP